MQSMARLGMGALNGVHESTTREPRPLLTVRFLTTGATRTTFQAVLQ